MEKEGEKQQEQAFFQEFQKRFLSHLSPDGSEIRVRMGKETFHLSLLQSESKKNYSLFLTSYKKHPFRHQMWYEPIGHADISVIGDTRASLSTSPFSEAPDLLERVGPQVQASVMVFMDDQDKIKINAMDVEQHHRGKNHGRLLYALSKAILRERGFTSLDIVGDRTGGFYTHHGAQPIPGLSVALQTPLTFNNAEQRVLSQLKIIR